MNILEEEKDDKEVKDLCLNCGKELNSELWGGICDCDNPNVVHRGKCQGCGKVIGFIIDDDYCVPEKLYCPECIENMIKHT